MKTTNGFKNQDAEKTQIFEEANSTQDLRHMDF